MKLENQVCTLEQAKRLKEFGLNVISYFYWYRDLHVTNISGYKYKTCFEMDLICPAYSVAELGEMLPEYVSDEWFLEMYKDSSMSNYIAEWFLIRYVKHDGLGNKDIKIGFNKKTEAEARAAMLIYLIENKIIDVQTLNNETN